MAWAIMRAAPSPELTLPARGRIPVISGESPLRRTRLPAILVCPGQQIHPLAPAGQILQ